MRTLIVDDHVLFREGLASLLNAQPDFEVVGGAGSVREGVEAALRLKPDLVLMDFALPDGSGAEASQAILAELPECKIVFLTVYEADAALFAAIRSGARGYLLKSMPISKVVTALRALQVGELAIPRALTSRIVEEFSRSAPVENGRENEFGNLSLREIEILQLIAKGVPNREIAAQLFLSPNTIKHHVHSILAKLNVHNRREAANLARRRGLL